MKYKPAVMKLVLNAIYLHCLSCCGGCPNDISTCDMTSCSLYPYRLRKVPKDLAIRAEELLASSASPQMQDQK